VLDLDDIDHYECVWLPSFFFGPEVLAAALPKISYEAARQALAVPVPGSSVI
jgi:hypothetical protein